MKKKIKIVSKEEYLKIFEEKTTRNKQARTGFNSIMGKYVGPGIEFHPKKFRPGEIIHTVAYHYVEDEYGNDINQNIIFVNPNIVTGEYRVVKSDFNGGWYCVKIKDIWGGTGTTAYVGKDAILENFKKVK